MLSSKSLGVIFGIISINSLSGCAAVDTFSTKLFSSSESESVRKGINYNFDEKKLVSDIKNQDEYLEQFARSAGLAGMPKPVSTNASSEIHDWESVAMGGFLYVNQLCSGYISELYQYQDAHERTRRLVTNEITGIGTAATAIAGVAGASSNWLAYLASVFGLTTLTANNIFDYSTVRYSAPAAKDVTDALFSDLRQTLGENQGRIVTRYQAVDVIQRSITACMPYTIEAVTTKAAQTSKIENLTSKNDKEKQDSAKDGDTKSKTRKNGSSLSGELPTSLIERIQKDNLKSGSRSNSLLFKSQSVRVNNQ